MVRNCPLCEFEGKTVARVRQHLHVNHRKFDLVDAVIADAERPTAD